jgi:hypothetical protein
MKHTVYTNVSIVRTNGCTTVVGYLPSGLDSSLGESEKKLSHAKRHTHKYIFVTHCYCFCICYVLRSVDRASLYKLTNKANLVHNFSLHVSGDYVPIIRRNNCVLSTLGTCYSVWMTVWYAVSFHPAYQTVIHTE